MAGRIPEDTIEDVRQRSDLVGVVESYLPLKRRGSDFWACCPFHKEKTPSFKISPAHQTFHCFGCGKSGNVYHFVMELENVDFVGAVRLLAKRAGVLIPEEPVFDHQGSKRSGVTKERILDLLEKAAAWYRSQLESAPAEAARSYLRERQVDADTIHTFGLGFSPDSWDAVLQFGKRQGVDEDLLEAAGLVIRSDKPGSNRVYDRFRGRLMFPIWDPLGRVVGFSARSLEQDTKTAKYINTPETAVCHNGKLLYGLHLARQAFKTSGHALVCEGQLDVIACHRAGLAQAVAPQGTAFTEMQARGLKRFTDTVSFAFDADEAGEKAAERSLEVAFAAELKARVVVLPEGQDPDSLFRTVGAEELKRIMAGDLDAFDFLLDLAGHQHDASTPPGKDAIVRQILAVAIKQAKPVLRAARCQWLSQHLGLPEAAVFDTLNQMLMAERRASGRHSSWRRNEDTPGHPAASRGGDARLRSQLDAAYLMLLDLAIHHEPSAHVLAENEQLMPDQMADTPAAHALGLVLGKTADGDWAAAGQALASQPELAERPAIARVLVDSHFSAPEEATAKERDHDSHAQRCRQATADCLNVLEREIIKEGLARIQSELVEATDPEQTRQLLEEYQSLCLRRTAMEGCPQVRKEQAPRMEKQGV